MASPPDYYISSDYSPYDDSSYAQQQAPTLNSKILVPAIVVLFCVIFFISSLHIIYGKWRWRSRTVNSRRQQFQWRNEGRASAAMRTAGLSKDTIALLPTFTYTAPSMADTDTSENASPFECAVCLSEFQENEEARILPACKHCFHIECIDMWFYSHSTCPLCRTVVLPTINARSSSAAAAILPTHGQQERGHEEGEEEDAVHEIRIAIDSAISSTTWSSTHDTANPPAATTMPSTNATEILAVPKPDPAHNTEKPSSSSLINHTTRHLRVPPHITIEIPTRQDMQITSPGCISLPSRRWRGHASPHDQSCSSHTSLKSPAGMGVSLKRILSR